MQEQRYRRLTVFVSAFILWALMSAMWGAVWYSSYADVIDSPYYRRGNWVIVIVYAVLLYFITQFYGGYRVGYSRRGDLIFSNIISMFVLNVITYFQTSLIGRRLMNVRPFLVLCIAQFILIWVWATIAVKMYLRLNPPRHLLLVYGSSDMAQSLIPKIIERKDKYIIKEAIDIEQGLLQVMDKIDGYQAVLICDVKSGHRNRILKYCYQRDIRVYMTPKISDILIRGSKDIHLFDTPLLLSRNEGLSLEQRILKRAMDIVLSLLGLVIGSPLMILTAVAIRIEDRGPVLYGQERLTQGGKAFKLYKFRSMIVDAEKETGARLASKSDDRVTKVGRFIRRFRLDELPQFLNILKGEMSFVGPRPERPELAEKNRQAMAEFDFRLKVKAGLTGFAQIVGKYNTTPYDKLKLDLMYIANYSVMLDIKLILQTIKTLFIKGSTEGVEKVTVYKEKA